MKISSVQAILLSYPFPDPIHLRYYGGERTILKRDAMLIRVETDKGIIGYAPGQATEAAKTAVDGPIAQFLNGRTLADPDALRVLFLKETPEDEYLCRMYASVEMALYDALGKVKGLPVSVDRGRVRDRIRLYGSAGMYMPPEQYAEEAHAVASLGFRGYKMRPALGPEEDLRTVKLMRKAVGSSLDLMVDAHTWWRMGDKSYGRETVEHLAQELAEYVIAWLEEPLPPDDHEAYIKLREANYVPLASGEHEPDEQRFLDLIWNDCVDYVQMDVICQGGFSIARRLITEIAGMNLKFAFHSWGTALEVAAAAQLGVCWPENVVEWLEYPCYSTSKLRACTPFP
ncbi:MAG: mandelate racemase/muconate lactonizing enzyme family protein [Bryobacteraceae bacterium]